MDLPLNGGIAPLRDLPILPHLFPFADDERLEDENDGLLDLNAMSPEQVRFFFRFHKEHLADLAGTLLNPEVITRNGLRVSGLEALCILLRRLAYPNRLGDIAKMFGRHRSEISAIFNAALQDIYMMFDDLLCELDRPWLVNSLPRFAQAIYDKGASLDRCWGFIDGTVRPICRPSRNQRQVFNGHKRVHSLKYQSIMAPNGIIATLEGPYEGRHHDSYMLRESETLEKLAQIADGQYYIYGDPAYPTRRNLITGFVGDMNEEEADFNQSMSQVRQCVEWGFGKVLQQWAFLDYKKNQKLYLQPVGLYYRVAVLLTNIHTCLYGSQTSDYFGIRPPTVEEYIATE